MNDFPLGQDDPRLTAYALGELTGKGERAEVERLLAASPAARASVEEIRWLTGLLVAEYDHEREGAPDTRDTAPGRADDLIEFPRPEVKTFPWWSQPWLKIAACVGVLAAVGALAAPALRRVNQDARPTLAASAPALVPSPEAALPPAVPSAVERQTASPGPVPTNQLLALNPMKLSENLDEAPAAPGSSVMEPAAALPVAPAPMLTRASVANGSADGSARRAMPAPATRMLAPKAVPSGGSGPSQSAPASAASFTQITSSQPASFKSSAGVRGDYTGETDGVFDKADAKKPAPPAFGLRGLEVSPWGNFPPAERAEAASEKLGLGNLRLD